MSKRIVILGGGESGAGSAVLAKKEGFDVFLSDFGPIKPNYKELLEKYQIRWEEKCHTNELILNADEVVKSPGIPDSAPIIKALKEKGVNIISEIEFAGRYTNAKMICITGSNGKTTTTLLTHHLLKKAGLNVGLAGNVGQSFALQVAENDYDYFVLELSSFQLDGMFEFKPDIAVLMNITPDHLDRYEYDFQNYVDSKFRIVKNLTEKDSFIYCKDDEVITQEIEKIDLIATLLPFTLQDDEGQSAYVKDNELTINAQNTKINMSIIDLALQGKHNTYNSMAAGLAGSVLKIRKDFIRESLMDFQSVEHRLEPVLKIHGIDFINDSKATNINSTWYALESMDDKVIWIAGGVDKGNDYNMLMDLVKDKVKAIICLGVDNTKLHEAFEGVVETMVDTVSMEEAVKAAYCLGKKGDAVLLSPACASFDLFDDYEDRGYQFKAAVSTL